MSEFLRQDDVTVTQGRGNKWLMKLKGLGSMESAIDKAALLPHLKPISSQNHTLPSFPPSSRPTNTTQLQQEPKLLQAISIMADTTATSTTPSSTETPKLPANGSICWIAIPAPDVKACKVRMIPPLLDHPLLSSRFLHTKNPHLEFPTGDV